MPAVAPRRHLLNLVDGVPASALEPVTDERAVLFWVHRGRAEVMLDGHESVVLDEGRALWLPPGRRHSARTDPGTVVVPVLIGLEEVPAALEHPLLVEVPRDWRDWLLYRVARSFGFASGAGRDRAQLLRLLTGAAPGPGLPPRPRAPGLRAVVERLRADPAAPLDVQALAALASMSPRTLQRRLIEQTGCSLTRWRAALRIDEAARHLEHGRDLGWTAHRVGYTSASAFGHAFAARMGVSPGRYALRQRGAPAAPLSAFRTVAPAPAIPAAPRSSSIADVDSCFWVRTGSVRVEAAGRRWSLGEGDVILLPRGTAHVVEIAAGSVMLPLGWRRGDDRMRPAEPRVVRAPEGADALLLHSVVANHFLLRPPGHDDQAFLAVLGLDEREPPVLPPHLAAIVAGVIADPADTRGIADWAEQLGIDPTALRRDFAGALGTTLPRWRASARMTAARTLLWDGHAPSSVARSLGYAHLPAFSKAFAAAHGLPPREWQRREETAG
jgi:transcriptional regulator GlxA family with amidase domain/mannose-6-phosphate isomerase-like protein (cupin superfamily)